MFVRIAPLLTPGRTTAEIDQVVAGEIRSLGGEAAFKGYRGFPANACISVNEEVVHGIPGERRLQEGDIVSVDVGIRYNGFHADAARTFPVGRIDRMSAHLINTVHGCLQAALSRLRPGLRLGDVSAAIAAHAQNAGLAVIRELGGHGIGRALHEAPHVFNYGEPGQGPLLQPGTVLAIEPILCCGEGRVRKSADGWTLRTVDGSRAAHVEETVLVAEDGPEILTRRKERS